MQREFWNDIGRESDDGETLPRFLPTMTVTTAMHPGRVKLKPGQQTSLSQEVNALGGKPTSSVAASHARTSATPEKEQDSMANAQDSSTKSPVSLAYFDPDTCCWRTWQRCLLEGWERFSGRWPRSGTMRNGIAYRLPQLVPRISGTGSSFWRTPNATDGTNGGPNARDSSGAPHLTAQVTWPTPSGCGFSNEGQGARVAEMASSYEEAVAMTDGRKSVVNRYWEGDQTETTGGQLNPTWVEWLMGFPLGWTDLSV
jgi:hypothetical protein